MHIEIAFLLTTDSFINAYRRFVSIRGKVNVLLSDCGTNFIGAEREIRHELDGIDNNKVRAHSRMLVSSSLMFRLLAMLVACGRDKYVQSEESWLHY